MSDPAPPSLKVVTQSDDYYLYTVHYGIINLGTASIQIIGDTTINGLKYKLLFSAIKSNPSIPFVGNKERHYYEIISINDTTIYAHEFWSHSVHKNEFFDTRYSFDYLNKRVVYSEFEEPKDTLELLGRAGSGPALFYLTRHFAGLDSTILYPVYTEKEIGMMEMNFTTKKSNIRVGYYQNNPVESYHMYGNANLFGPFGFSGRFDVWHDGGPDRIPLETHVKVWLGSIKIRLSEIQKSTN